MAVTRFTLLTAVCLALLLQACAAVSPAGRASLPPPENESVPEEQKHGPELNLNLPAQSVEVVDHSLLEKGFRALAEGDHREAVNYFRRYQRLESSPAEDWEAEIAVTYDKMFPDSPYYNSKVASESYHRLKGRQPDGAVHDKILMMRDALAIFVALHAKIDDQQDENDLLEDENALLAEDLEKRDEALKRLRELVLGQ